MYSFHFWPLTVQNDSNFLHILFFSGEGYTWLQISTFKDFKTLLIFEFSYLSIKQKNQRIPRFRLPVDNWSLSIPVALQATNTQWLFTVTVLKAFIDLIICFRQELFFSKVKYEGDSNEKLK